MVVVGGGVVGGMSVEQDSGPFPFSVITMMQHS
jgi:hypothetical protein